MRQERVAQPRLQQELGVLGATLMGLGSIVGTGVFVSIGIGAGIAGPAVVVAVAIAAIVALDSWWRRWGLEPWVTTWSFSSFSVLIYYAITNVAALRIPTRDRLYPSWIAWASSV